MHRFSLRPVVLKRFGRSGPPGLPTARDSGPSTWQIALLLFLAPSALAAADFQPQVETINKLVDDYCLRCHLGEHARGEFDLTKFDAAIALSKKPWDTTDWERALKRLRARQMPPPAAPRRPSEAEYRQLTQAMAAILEQHATAYPHPGQVDPIRRLNRTEYRNAIRDLLALEVDVADLLPADQSGHGFDNVTLGQLSPALLSRYVTAAERIARQAVGGPQRSVGGFTLRLPADRTQESHVAGLPLGTRGGTLIKHHFPATGEYEIQLRLMRDRDENIEGLNGSHDIDVLLDRALVHRFTVKSPKGGKGYQRDDTLVDANLKKRFQVTAGPHQLGVTFPKKLDRLEEIRRQPFDARFNRHRHPRHAPALYEVSIVGPFATKGPGDTPSRRRIFTSYPGSSKEFADDAESILRRLARLAYRRPVTDADLEVPMQFFRERADADGFEAGIESALTTILANPHFLLRAEVTSSGVTSGEPYRIPSLELASRLSFFLWSSLPDDELLGHAESGQLHHPEVLKTQVERMLTDARSESLVSNFAAQWLYLRNLDNFRPDMRRFPDFDDNLRHALRRETELLFEHVLRQDQSVLKLIDSDITFLNERLAKHYGIPHVYGSEFRPVKVAGTKHPRGGILRHGSILAVTSYATRTSPTVRGSWILENILGTPPPPPPPNVPSLKDKTATSAVTIRERLAEHRANQACASCHDRIDPVGFGLENFDAVGRWRLFDQEQPVDAAGALPDGTSVSGPAELEAGILAHPELFVGTLTEKLLTFALGRGVEPADGPAVRKIVRDAAKHQYRFSSLILGIASSHPFQMRVAP